MYEKMRIYVVSILLVFCGIAAGDTLVFEEEFNSGTGQWSYVEGTGDVLTVAGGVGELGYRSIYAPLSAPSVATTLEFDVKAGIVGVDMGYVYLLDAAGTKGFALRIGRNGTPNTQFFSMEEWDYTDRPIRGTFHAGTPNYFTGLGGYNYLSGGTSSDIRDAFIHVTFTIDDVGNGTLDIDGGTEYGTLSLSAAAPNHAGITLTQIQIQGPTDGGETDIYDNITVSSVVELATCQEVIDGGFKIVGDLNNDCYVDLEDFAILASQWQVCIHPDDPLCTW